MHIINKWIKKSVRENFTEKISSELMHSSRKSGMLDWFAPKLGLKEAHQLISC